MKPVFTSLVVFLFLIAANAQVAINTDGSNPEANTMLDVKSTNRGVKFPRLTSTQRKAMSVSAVDAGLMVFDTDRQCLYMYNGIEWLPFAYASTSAMGPLTKQTLPENTWQARRYGWAVSVNGDYAAVSATEDTLNATTTSGSVYVYHRVNGNWVLEARILAPDAASGDEFGYTVCLAGDDLIVGAVAKHNGAVNYQGAAYVFHRNGQNWPLQQKLLASDGTANAFFGGEVEISGNTAIVGAHGTKVGNNISQGAVYVFTRNGAVWTQQAKLLADDGAAEAYFGTSASLDGDFMAIGASSAKTNGVTHGAVYIFVKVGNTWLQQKKVLSNSPLGGGRFGLSVSLHNDLLVVGAPSEKYAATQAGVVHVYRRSGSSWIHSHTLFPVSEEYDTRFGTTVLVRDGYIFVSSPRERVGDISPGMVHVYKADENSVRIMKRITMPDATSDIYWAQDLSFDGKHYIMSSYSAYRDITKSENKGVVFFGMIE
jgi:hypothetical protein